jgi:hypothetical protein
MSETVEVIKSFKFEKTNSTGKDPSFCDSSNDSITINKGHMCSNDSHQPSR